MAMPRSGVELPRLGAALAPRLDEVRVLVELGDARVADAVALSVGDVDVALRVPREAAVRTKLSPGMPAPAVRPVRVHRLAAAAAAGAPAGKPRPRLEHRRGLRARGRVGAAPGAPARTAIASACGSSPAESGRRDRTDHLRRSAVDDPDVVLRSIRTAWALLKP